ncbi:hypothetical protein [Kluyvera genomosp. 3]|uniref:Uncharacterized protein n=1 Tax=Kluyvera genomosp. 3 TaxID=2774055 RepID=A0A6G9RKB0_9ENTR|nr:hypothetical protein [Kluyvera genomosp. 3]QIR26705.1 hypothetical protein GY169_07680 [Kluyvera genomosp. 3]
MGGAVKKILGGGGSSKSTVKEQSSGTASSFLMNNTDYKNYTNQAIKEIGNISVSPQQMAEMPAAERAALQNLMTGQDYSQYTKAQQLMTSGGEKLFNQGQEQLSGATDILSRLQNLSQADYQNMLSSEMNNDLVKSQIGQATEDINAYAQKQEHALDQSAIGSGNINSSRAGVAQGVIIGNAAKAIGSASVQYRTAEEQNAQNRLMSYLNLQSGTASQLANIGQNQQSTGLNMYGQGMGYYGQGIAGNLQNQQNAVNAGNMLRTYQQQQLDINRYNQQLMSAPSLARLGYANQYLLNMAELSKTSTGTTTQTTKTPSSGGGLLTPIMAMGGMAMGNSGMLNGIFGSTKDAAGGYSQQQQAGGVFGGMFGQALSSF